MGRTESQQLQRHRPSPHGGRSNRYQRAVLHSLFPLHRRYAMLRNQMRFHNPPGRNPNSVRHKLRPAHRHQRAVLNRLLRRSHCVPLPTLRSYNAKLSKACSAKVVLSKHCRLCMVNTAPFYESKIFRRYPCLLRRHRQLPRRRRSNRCQRAVLHSLRPLHRRHSLLPTAPKQLR